MVEFAVSFHGAGFPRRVVGYSYRRAILYGRFFYIHCMWISAWYQLLDSLWLSERVPSFRDSLTVPGQ